MHTVEVLSFLPQFPFPTLGNSFSMTNHLHFFCYYHNMAILVQNASSPPNHMTTKSSFLNLVCHSLVDELFALPRLGYDGLQHAVSQGHNQVLALTCLVMWNVTVSVLLHWCLTVNVLNACDPPSWWGLIRFFSTSCLGNCKHNYDLIMVIHLKYSISSC